MEAVGDSIPGPEARHHEWTAFGYRWAELDVLRLEANAAARASEMGTLPRAETGARVAALREEVDRAFLAWAERRYAGLHNQPPDPPVMVHHVPRYLARRIEDGSAGKVALIVVDGLALDQWLVLRDVLADQRPGFRFREGAVFAWVPTITSVSRQAIFAGKPPFYFPSSIHTTDREASSWRQFWTDQGVAARAVGYAKGLGDGPLDGVDEVLSRADLRALGLVVDKVDRIMHGMELGAAGMHNQVRQWAGEGLMAALLDRLLGDGFAVYLTSDHGNIEAEGGGRPSEGALADTRGERARIYFRRPAAVPRTRAIPGRDRMARHRASRRLPGPARPRPVGVRSGRRARRRARRSFPRRGRRPVCADRADSGMNRRDQIGFSQRIHLDWLDYTANLVLAGNPRDEIVAALQDRLKEKLSSGNRPVRGNRDKAISILTKVWVTVPREVPAAPRRGARPPSRSGPERPATGALVHVHGGLPFLRHRCRRRRPPASPPGNRRRRPGSTPTPRTLR